MSVIKTSVLPVTGMTCSNCARAIDLNVSKLNGVKNARVDFAGEKLILEFDPTMISEKEVIASVHRVLDMVLLRANWNCLSPVFRILLML